MKRPSFSIAEMMVIVAVVALDCAALRVARSGPAIPYLVFGGLLMQIALVIGLLRLIRRRRRKEKPYTFIIGFEVIGWISHLCYVILCVHSAESLDTHLFAILRSVAVCHGLYAVIAP